MPKRNPQKSVESALRKAALAYPQATEDFPWGHRAFKIKKKLFLILSYDKDIFNVTVKLPITGKQALSLPFAQPTGYGLGKSGWVTASFGPKVKVPVELLEDWVDESYRAIAPKKIVQALAGRTVD
ncbi:MAG: MmcQ/YjbR family DNA-binding protein [Pirellulaceae bacterium]